MKLIVITLIGVFWYTNSSMKPNVFLIAQNVNIYLGDGKHPFARTGDIGFYHLKKSRAMGIILGHSEVRDEPGVVNKKWKSALQYGLLRNVVLIGEDWEDLKKGWAKSSKKDIEKMKRDFNGKFLTIINGIDKKVIEKTVFGYEPSWGTKGSGKSGVLPPQPPQIESMCLCIRGILEKKYGKDLAKKVKIIYG